MHIGHSDFGFTAGAAFHRQFVVRRIIPAQITVDPQLAIVTAVIAFNDQVVARRVAG
ncbi:hypothetical protein D3C80_2200060 [compost metagenome]